MEEEENKMRLLTTIGRSNRQQLRLEYYIRSIICHPAPEDLLDLDSATGTASTQLRYSLTSTSGDRKDQMCFFSTAVDLCVSVLEISNELTTPSIGGRPLSVIVNIHMLFKGVVFLPE